LRELLGIREQIRNLFMGDEARFLMVCLLNIFHEFANAKRDGGFLRFVDKEYIPDPKKRFKEVVLDTLMISHLII